MLIPLVIVLAGTLVLSIKATPGQDERQSELQMTVSTTAMMLCLGSSLPLELKIANEGNREVKIDKVDLWNRFTYGFSRPDGSGGGGVGGGTASGCSHCRGNYVVLKPSGHYESSFKFLLVDPFFKEPGMYRIKMHYEQISTNELSFELYDCNPK